jgi:hypothetical protein
MEALRIRFMTEISSCPLFGLPDIKLTEAALSGCWLNLTPGNPASPISQSGQKKQMKKRQAGCAVPCLLLCAGISTINGWRGQARVRNWQNNPGAMEESNPGSRRPLKPPDCRATFRVSDNNGTKGGFGSGKSLKINQAPVAQLDRASAF